MFLKNCWYVIAWSHEVPAEGFLARRVLDEPLLVYRTSEGKIVALADRCCHRHAPLSHGRREGDDIRCMYHGLRFAPSGRCNEIPGVLYVPPKVRVRDPRTFRPRVTGRLASQPHFISPLATLAPICNATLMPAFG